MSFVETEASVRYETIDGKRVPVITPKTEVTLTNTETGQEYMSDAEAMQDVQNPNTCISYYARSNCYTANFSNAKDI